MSKESYGKIVVIGAGHAGIEASLAAARMGLSVTLLTLTLDLVGNMPCNPSIGGTGKGHLVYEIDALGGEMGKAADEALLQSRMLNKSKGAAVHSLRLQTDRVAYRSYMKRIIENTKGVDIVQCEATSIRVEAGRVIGVETSFGVFYEASAVVICTGTSLGGRITAGKDSYSAGADNTVAATRLSDSLHNIGINLMRFKTGTPPRLHADSIDYDKLEIQSGDERVITFTGVEKENKAICHIAYTNEKTHKILRDNLNLSPMFSGVIKGIGPRYCPSIEDKIVRFPDKERHQLFIEPMGADTKEVYLQGFSSSMPEYVQRQAVRSVIGLENAVFMRPAYAIEYDCCDPTQLHPTLEFKNISGLYGAGQFNGSSGYEEAAAQGLIAGINAALKIKGEDTLILTRSDGYIGTLIDDLVTKGTDEPYRMMTSRTEYRLILRQDNAKERLMEKGYTAGLVSEERYSQFLSERERIDSEIARLRTETQKCTDELSELLISRGYDVLTDGIKKAELLKRPHITIFDIYDLEGTKNINIKEAEKVQTEIKYEGYIAKQSKEIERFRKEERKLIPDDIDYKKIKGIRAETAQKLSFFKPKSIGQAARISGVSPADMSVLLVYLSEYGGKA